MKSPDLHTRDLLRRLLQDDADAWRRFVQAYAGFLLALARRAFREYGVRPQEQDCQDVVADVWKNLLEHDRRLIGRCLERDNLLQTLQVLVRHRAVDLMRRRLGRMGPLPSQLEAADAPPESRMENDSETQALAGALEDLPPRERTLVRLFFLHRRKYREIEALTGIPSNSIGPTLARALARLRKMLAAF